MKTNWGMPGLSCMIVAPPLWRFTSTSFAEDSVYDFTSSFRITRCHRYNRSSRAGYRSSPGAKHCFHDHQLIHEKNNHMGRTALQLVTQKLNKQQKLQKYDPFASGELATCSRFIFEQMRSSGITKAVQKHINQNGLPAYSANNFTDSFTALTKAGTTVPVATLQSQMQARTTNGTKASTMLTTFVKAHGLYAYHNGLHDLLRLRTQGPNTVVPGATSAIPTAYEGGASASPAVFEGGLTIHPSLSRAAAATAIADIGQKLEPMVASPQCASECDGGDSDGDGYGDGDSDGDGDSYGDSDGGDSGGDSGIGDPGDPDTSEESNGTVVYEDTLFVTAVQTCTVLDSVGSLGAGLSAASVQAWASSNPEQAAAFAASIGFASPEILIAFLVGLAAIAAYYAVFCEDSSSIGTPDKGVKRV